MEILSDFIKVSNIEVNNLIHLAQNTAEAQEEEIYKTVTKLDLLMVVKLALQNSDVDRLCKLPMFDNYWEEIWRQCGENTREEAFINKLPIHEYEPQPTVHTFDFLKSIVLYRQYLSIMDTEIEGAETIALPYLAVAAELDYFPALVRANKRLIELYRENKDESLALEAINLAERAAEKYWAAGYFLLGITYIHLNQGSYLEAFSALLIAKKLVPFSEVMLNNAFQGQSLSAVTYGGIKDWDDISNYFARVQGSLKLYEINQIYKTANEVFEALKVRWFQPEELPAPDLDLGMQI